MSPTDRNDGRILTSLLFNPGYVAFLPSFRDIRIPAAFGAFVLLYVGGLATGWLGQPLTSGELAGHAARIEHFLESSRENGVTAWLPEYLGGHPTVALSSSILSWLVFIPGVIILGPVAGLKVTALVLLALAAAAAYLLGQRLTASSAVGFVIGVIYLTAPQILLRTAWLEHMTIVVCFPLVPLAFWALLRCGERGSLFDALLLISVVSATFLAWTKMAVALIVPLALFAALIFLKNPATRGNLLRSAVVVVPGVFALAILPLLPLVREQSFMTLFELDPFATWQAQFSIKTTTSWLDRGGNLLLGLPGSLRVERGGYYLGFVGLIAVAGAIIRFWHIPRWRAGSSARLLSVVRTFLVIFLVLHWLSFGPRNVVSGHFAILSAAMRLPDVAIPVHWAALVAPLFAIWWLLPASPVTGRRQAVLGAVMIGVYLFVPGFRIVEAAMPSFDLRAPDTFWILNGTLSWAVCAGCSIVLLVRQLSYPAIRTSAAATAIALILIDGSHYTRWFFQSNLPVTHHQNYDDALAHLAKRDAGRVFAVSTRYRYLDIPVRTGRPLVIDSLNRYLMPKHSARLNGAAQTSATALLSYLRAAGVSDVLIDKTDRGIPKAFTELLTSLLPTVFENSDFAILQNDAALYPAFIAGAHEYGTSARAESLKALGLLRRETLVIAGSSDEAKESREATVIETVAVERNGDSYHISPPRAGWIVLSTSWHPDWTAKQTDPLPVVRAAGGFPATWIDAAGKDVEFHFESPRWYGFCFGVAAISWAGVLASLVALPLFARQLTAPVKPRPQPAPHRQTIGKPVVLVPTFNEAESISKLLDLVLAEVPTADIVVIDDASPDGTATLVREHAEFGSRIHLIGRSGKRGLGPAYRDGFEWALARGYDSIVQIDADLSHDPRDIQTLLAALDQGRDLAIGSRYCDGIRVVNWPRHRLALSRGATTMARLLTGLPVSDVTSGFKAIRASALAALPWQDELRADGYGFQIELLWLAWQHERVLCEVPITFTERRAGKTKMTFSIALEAAILLVGLAFRSRPVATRLAK